MRRLLLLEALLLLLPGVASAQMSYTDTGSGINEVVTITSTNQFQLVFEATGNWGLTQWYDLVNDPTKTTNLALAYSVNGTLDPCARESGIPQITLYGDADKKATMFEAGCNYAGSARSKSILASNALEIVLQTSGFPMGAGPIIDTNVVWTTTYYIYWNGKIVVNQALHVTSAEDLTAGGTAGNFVISMGLNDPAGGSSTATTSGWIRATNTQNPYSYDFPWDKYVFAYWNSSDPNYPNFTKASILVVPGTTAKNLWASGGGHILHGWSCGTGCGTQRWGFTSAANDTNLNMGAGATVTWDFLIQLGTQNSSVLPNITSSTVADPIANAYLAAQSAPVITFAPVVAAGGTTTFSCLTNCGAGATPWSCANASNGGTCLGSINSSSGVYTAPASLIANQSLGGYPLLPPDHIFNTNIASLPTRSDSTTLINGAGTNPFNYLPSFRFNYTTNSTSTDPLSFYYTPGNNAAFSSPGWPAVIEGGWFDAQINDTNQDHHMMTIGTDTGNVSERYQFYGQAPVTSCSITSNVAICTITPTTTSPGFARAAALGRQFSMGGWTGGDTYLNGLFTLTSATATTITFGVTHANATTSTSGQATLNIQGGGCSTAGTCNSQSGVQYTSTSYGLPANGTTDAAGLYLAPLTLHTQEVVNACANGTAIKHALRVTLANGWMHNAILWPATTFAGGGTGVNYFGERIRLKSSFAIGSFSACAQVLLTQLKNYGLIVADNGGGGSGNWQQQFDFDNTPAAAVAALQEINTAAIAPSNFEVVDESSLVEQPFMGSASNGEIITYTSSTGTATSHVDLQGTALSTATHQYYIMAGTPQQQLTFYSNGAFTCAMSPTVGSITSGCLYTPPGSVGSATTTTVTATSSVNGSVTAQMIVYVLPSPIRLIEYTADYTDSHSNVWYSGIRTGNNIGVGFLNIPSWQGSSQGDGNITGTDKQLYWYRMFSSFTGGDYKMDFYVPQGSYLVTFNNGTTLPAGSDVRYFYVQGSLVATLDSTALAGGVDKQWFTTFTATVGANNKLSIYNAGIGGQTYNTGDISSISIAPIGAAVTAAPQNRAILLP